LFLVSKAKIFQPSLIVLEPLFNSNLNDKIINNYKFYYFYKKIMFTQSVYINRRNNLKSKGLKGVGLFLGNTESPMNYAANTYKFRQDSTFLYFLV